MRVSFYGACREVTGSNILLEGKDFKVLLECGLFQGYKLSEERNYSKFNFDPSSIDSVVVCHAHLDHTGRLSKLVKDGFGGPIFSTEPTRDLTKLVLDDNEKLMREEAEKENHAPLYSIENVEETMSLFNVIPYNKKVNIAKNVDLTFINAGHILGSAIAIIEAEDKKLVYTSDLGNNPSVLLDAPSTVESCDFLICESTYGGRVHEDVNKRKEQLSQIIRNTISGNGVLIIPSFAIERTQELLHDIEDFCTIDGCEKPAFYLDSPLAEKVTGVFRKYPQFLNMKIRDEHKDFDFFGLERLKITTSVTDSKSIRSQPNPKVIIAGSGMMNGGRILFHARDFLGDENNSILIVGYQSFGTLGRRILEGDKTVKILGEKINIFAKVLAIGSYSAHADSPQILDWVGNIRNLKKVFLVHGEIDQSQILSQKLESKINVNVEIPQLGGSYEL